MVGPALSCASEPTDYPSYGSTTGSASGTTGSAGPAFANFAEASQWIGSTCGVVGCHGNKYPPSLSNADLGVLEYTLTSYPVERCGGAPLVVPGNADGSSITRAVAGACDTLLMPFGCVTPPEVPCVSTEDLAKLKGWIAGGTPFQ